MRAYCPACLEWAENLSNIASKLTEVYAQVGSGVDQTMDSPHGYDAYHRRQTVALANAPVMLDLLSWHVVYENTGVRSRPKKVGQVTRGQYA